MNSPSSKKKPLLRSGSDPVHASSSTRRDTQEMTDIASDHHDESAGAVTKLDSYEIIEDPPSKHQQINSNRRRRTTWTGTNKYPRSQPNRPYSVAPLRLSSMDRANYSATERDNPSTSEIQAQYEREGFNMILGTADNQSENIIDGRFSMSMIEEDEDGFVSVEALGNSNDMSTAKALTMCTKYVLKPYNAFLKVIGWRSFRSQHVDDTPWYKRVCNVIYPTFIFLMLVFTSISQTVSCFSRTQATPPRSFDNESYYVLSCRDNVITGTVLGDFLILAAYLWAFYIFRFSEKEHLSRLMQTVFLSYNTKLVRNSQKHLVLVLLTFLTMGVVWVGFSTMTSVFRIFALRLEDSNTYIGWFLSDHDDPSSRIFNISNENYRHLHECLVVLSFFGFLFFDLLYIAVVINYVTQCQLLHFFIRNLKEKVRTKAFLLGYAVKEIFHVNEYLRVLNGKLANVTSLILFIFIQGVVFSYRDLMNVKANEHFGIVVGILNIIQWLSATLFLLIQSTRLTAECNGLRKLGLEIGARPFVYSDTPQLVLDSFVLYTNATNYKTKLGFIPMYPSLVFGFVFIMGLILTLDIGFTQFQFASWI